MTEEQPTPDTKPRPKRRWFLFGCASETEALEADPAQPKPAWEPPPTITRGRLHNPPIFSLRNILWVGFFLLLTVATDCSNYRTVFVTKPDGTGRQIYYLDGDCYSRMTRVREIMDHWGIIHYHAWENFPQGTWPHTTAPMDYLIVAIALLLKPFMAGYIDMAGAIVSPLLGLLTTGFLALWARELNQQYRRLTLLVVSLSPILVHGFALGRPDHQSLQIFLLAVAIGAELVMAKGPCMDWSIVSGAAWGLALWVSLYEPLVLMVVIYGTKLIFYRSKLFVKQRLCGLAVMVAILGVAYLLEGKYLVKSFSIESHDEALRSYFGNWSATIGEMFGLGTMGLYSSGIDVLSEVLFRWVGFGLLVSPLLLIARLRDTKRSVLLLALLVTTFVFTLMEARWGYFFALVYAMSLPWQLSLFNRRWLVWTLYLLSLWPVARQWEDQLFSETYSAPLVVQLNEQRALRDAAGYIRERAPGGILAPWWCSPALVYWSGQPAVAGSSHESLAGIVDTARFFSTGDPKLAKQICDERQVETVVMTEDLGTIVGNSVHILGQPLPPDGTTMAEMLWQKPSSTPMFLHRVFDNRFVKIFEVNHGSIVR